MAELKSHPKLKLFSLNSNRYLAEAISKAVGVPLSKATVEKFSDDEIKISVDESIRGDEVYIIQSISEPVNSNLMELLIMVDAVRRASAKSINVVIPYYGYSRADRKARSREPITAKLVASFLEMDGVDRVVTLDLHADQIQGFFDIPVDHLRANTLLANYFIKTHDGDNLVVVSPDHTGVSRARKFAELLDAPIAIIDNRSPEDATTVPESVIGNVKGKRAIIVDDMIDTAFKLTIAAETLKKAGATEVFAIATHAVFSGDAQKRLQDSAIKKVIVTDSISISKEDRFDKLEVVSVGDLFGQAITLIHNQQSVGKLFGR
ncbi:MAG: ribose-phosphate diphosphokinase [Lentilactobacillus diolivorans]|uniref:Putative ribose-phosphate pyrophosphokinase n=2 Tax=Lentilactobacillus diolivorans TaxID=179838 RepID=A0A0R1SIN2_9LACO|nr:ribose-phosphate diphosphokinase [Lentilactobacillus diolivorans]KRL65715.1 ribose-phosphate diphosphokinase [Lentilactobacillus diolivorans DSM 14421]MDH5105436.1 ribose-phosphate diphosphokinase [Lentilactobacillus diolivorans]GEP24365.1 ribose-phosphate pyrophosphokinase 2 [Lentilactobacillus diolivorans]